MDARLQLRVQRYGWDLAAPHYERAWNDALAPATVAVLDAAKLESGERVLDVACGGGVLARAAWEAVAPGGGEVVGSDISETMLAEAAANLPEGRFVRADAQALDQQVPLTYFDAVLCGLGLMYMPDPEAALVTMARTMRAGARMVVSVWGDRRACGWAEIFPIVDARVRSEVCPMFFRMGGADALARAMGEAGLIDIRTSRVPTQLVYADADAACDAAFLAGPVALAYSRFDARARDEVRAEYLASIEGWRDGSGYRVPGEFVIAAGRKRDDAVTA